jgi:hypothetical protein
LQLFYQSTKDSVTPVSELFFIPWLRRCDNRTMSASFTVTLNFLMCIGVTFAAHEILSDEEKRKNYDLYGDEKGNPGMGAGNFGSHDFTGGGPRTTYFSSGDGWQTMGGQGNAKTFSFSFGGNPGANGGNPFGFDIGDVFSNMFAGGSMGGGQHGGFAGSARPSARTSGQQKSPVTIQEVTMQTFNKEIADQGITWLLLFYTQQAKGQFVLESVLEDVARSLDGAVRVS